MSTIKILAIETSCDDTSMAIVEVAEPMKRGELPVFKVLKNIVSSQTDIHRHWGGVVPSLAKREHLKNLPRIYKNLKLKTPNLKLDYIAVTVGPGLEPSLWTGIEFAKKISAELNIPLVGANHLEGHLYSSLLSPASPSLRGVTTKQSLNNGERLPRPEDGARNDKRIDLSPKFPAIVLLVSGGHTILVLMKSLRGWQKLGETRDDAVGEAYDKVAKMIGLPYPGGPEIEKLATRGNPEAIKFPRPMINDKNYEFSFSGLKTAVLYYLKEHLPSLRGVPTTKQSLSEPSAISDKLLASLADISASFQAAAIDVLVTKTMRAVREFGAKSVFLCGGVAANKALRAELAKAAEENGAGFFAPSADYNTDNAAMIAGAAYMKLKSRKKKYPLEADSNLTL